MKRQRTITIGWVRAPWYVWMGQWGCPCGFYVHWAGRDNALRPTQFLKWREIIWALDNLLRLARLQRVGEPVRIREEFWERLKVTVQRFSGRESSCMDVATTAKADGSPVASHSVSAGAARSIELREGSRRDGV